REVSLRVKTLVSTPLLLTLLCILVLRKKEIPRRRADFYDECLKILLDRWVKARGEPPCEVAEAISILQPLAHRLHAEKRRDDLTSGEVQEWFGGEIDRIGRQKHAVLDVRRFLEWLHRDTGVMVEVAEDRFAFMHLGIQEYLAASHLARKGK